MNKFLSLLKVQFIEQYKLNKILNKENKIKKIGLISLVLVFITIMGINLYFIYNAVLLETKPDEAIKTLLLTAFSISSIILIISSLSQSYAYLFKGSDFDLLISMPIDHRQIVLAKIIGLIINNYLFLLLTFLPLIIIVMMNNLVSLIFYFNLTIILILFPLIIISITTLISYIVSIIFKNFKYKNILIITISILLFGSYFFFAFSQTDQYNNIFLILSNYLNYFYYPSMLAINALVYFSFKSLIIFIVVSIFVFYLFLNIISKIYLKANTNAFKPKSKKLKETKIIKENNIKALFKKEFKTYFSLTQYVLNTFIPKLLLPIITIIIFINLNDSDIKLPSDIIFLLIIGVSLFTLTLTSTTTSTLSLEKDTIWILKSSPLKVKEIFLAKMLVEIVLNFFVSLITIVIILIFNFDINIISLIILIVFLVVISIYNATLGLILNLKFPKFDWDLEIRAIKQSMSVFTHMIITFVLIIIIGLLTALMSIKTGYFILAQLSVLLFFIILTIILNIILFKKGTKWFLKL